VKTKVPSSLKKMLRCVIGESSYVFAKDFVEQWQTERDPRYRASMRRLSALRDSHAGQRCFIIGNGPSLKRTDMSPLKSEYTIGLNRIYLMFDELGFSTTYYACVNRLVVEQCAREIIDLVPCPKFISWRCRDLIHFTENMVFLHPRTSSPKFFTDMTYGIWEGATVTYVALQIAYFLGFSRVVLIGVDHSYEARGEPRAEVVSESADQNHFDGQYFGKGFRWQLPDLKTSELGYEIARYIFEKKEREIVDATIGGKLQVFPKVRYEELFE
jgi:hypothetical protein